MSNLEYTIKELPDLLPLGIRNNMMQNNMLLKDMGDSINTFKESVLNLKMAILILRIYQISITVQNI